MLVRCADVLKGKLYVMAYPLHRPIESACVEPFDPGAFVPMLAQRARSLDQLPDDWIVEHRWAGLRIVAGLGAGVLCLAGRGGRDFAPLFPELAALVDQVSARDWILDGEVVGLDEQGRPDHATIVSRVRDARGATTVTPGSAQLRFVAFDLIVVDGRDLRDEPWRARRAGLERVAHEGGPLLLTRPGTEPAQERLQVARADGFDGIVAKNPGAPYRSGMRPPGTWLELQVRRHASFLVTGSTALSTNGVDDPERVGSLHLAARMDDGTLRDAGRVGSGMDDAMRRSLANRLAGTNIPLVVEIEFASWTSEGRLRHPTFRSMRDDLHPDNFITELD